MTRKAFLKQYGIRFAAAFALLCLLFYTVYHVFAGSSDSLMTIPVRQVTDRQMVNVDAYLFREEEVMTASQKGLVNGLLPNGTKVSASTAVAEVWNTGNTATMSDDQITLDRVNRLIRILEDSIASGATLSKAQLYRKTTEDTFFSIQDAIADQDWSQLGKLEDEMLMLLDQYVFVTEGKVAIQATLERLRGVRSALLTGSCQTISAPERSGYFYHTSYVDGYESLFTPTALEDMSAERFAELTASEAVFPEGQVAGKMVYGHNWSLALSLNSTEKSLFSEGRNYVFCFPDNGDREIRLTCNRLIEGSDGGAVGVFEAQETPADFVYFRVQRVQITTDLCEGYYVPESALQTKDGINGVYIFKDSTVCFCRIEILHEGDGYYIVAENDGKDEEYLSLYDILITSGKNLYEGRVYQ